jgi:hypothetical protein
MMFVSIVANSLHGILNGFEKNARRVEESFTLKSDIV